MTIDQKQVAAQMRMSFSDIDRASQEAAEKIDIYATAIEEALSKSEPRLRGAIGLLELIRFEASSSCNDINYTAEKWAANYVEDEMADERNRRLEARDAYRRAGRTQ